VFGRLFDHERRFVSLKFGETAMLFIVLLFALAGASLEFTGWSTAAPLALAFVGARLVGKAVPILLLSNPSGLALRKSSLVSLGLMPMSSLALLMLHELMRLSPSLAAEIGSAMFLAITFLAFVGPLAIELALRRCGEAAEDTP
jgi:Kef-type K+ transport system membrane component KefB